MVKLGAFKKHHIISACLFLIGLVFFVKQITIGFEGYLDQYAWRVYIGLFFTAAGGGAGLLIITGYGILNGIIDISKAKKLYLFAVAMLITAGLFIIADLGYPAAMFKMITSPNLTAPMNADALVLFIAIVISFLAAAFLQLDGANKKKYAGVGIFIGIILLGVESWLVAISVRQEIWALMLGIAPALLHALIIGIAVVLLFQDDDNKHWRNWLCIGVLLILAVQLFDVFAGFGNQNRLGAQMRALAQSYTFWIGTAGMIASIIIGLLAGNKDSKNFWSKSIVFVAIFSIALVKLSVIWAGESSAALSQLDSFQKPHIAITEIFVVIGIIGLGILIYVVMDRIIQAFMSERVTKDKEASV